MGLRLIAFVQEELHWGQMKFLPECESMFLLRFPGLVQEYLHSVDERFFS